MTTTSGADRGAIDGRIRALFVPVDVAWLAAFRALFGAAMCISMLRFIAYGWIDSFFVNPAFHFKYWGFAWVEPLSRDGMHALFWALAALAFCVAIGAFFRVSAVLFTLGFTYLQLIDVTTYLNHYYLASLLGGLLAVSPAHRAYALDNVLLRRAPWPTVPRLWLYLLRFQVGVVYTFAGLAKAHGDWLMHAQPLRIWLSSNTGMPVIGPLFTFEWAPMVMSWAGFLFDTFIVWFLLYRKTRPFAYVLVIVFHTFTRMLFPIGMFPVIMVLGALVFFSPSWPRKALSFVFRIVGLRRLSREVRGNDDPIAQPVELGVRSMGWRRAGVAIGVLYCVLQVAMPLRYLAYGGNVRWHEQGMRFSWRVMVREKNGSTTFIVRNKQTGRTWEVSPRDYLTRLQEREMSGQPDLILQLAHHIRGDFARRGLGDVEVHVDSLVSLNGRRGARMIDPAVDLASVSDGLGHAFWILPSPTMPPPHTHPI